MGDGTTNPVKQGGIACQQADAAAAAVAAAFGTPVDPVPRPAGLRGWMWDGRRGRALPAGTADADPDEAPVWPVAKIGGRFLAPLLHAMVADERLTGAVGVPS